MSLGIVILYIYTFKRIKLLKLVNRKIKRLRLTITFFKLEEKNLICM